MKNKKVPLSDDMKIYFNEHEVDKQISDRKMDSDSIKNNDIDINSIEQNNRDEKSIVENSVDENSIDENSINDKNIDQNYLNQINLDDKKVVAKDTEDKNIKENDAIYEEDIIEEIEDDILDFTNDSTTINGEKFIDLLIDESNKGVRIDKLIADERTELSRSYIQKLIKDQEVLVNDKPIKSNYKSVFSDRITIHIPKPKELNIEAEDIKLDIIYEDRDVILINKPKGMVVHPSVGHYSGTLVNALLYHCKDELSGINGILRPGIVHRIDMNTTGVMIACKNDFAHTFIAEQLKAHSITRKYNALVYGKFNELEGKVDAPIGRHSVERRKMAINVNNGKRAVTHYHVLENIGSQYTHVECTLETGRTHQIRVHLSSIHHPLIGDDIYGPTKDVFHLQGQALHARVFGFIHPSTKEYMEFEAPLPVYFDELIKKLRNKSKQ